MNWLYGFGVMGLVMLVIGIIFFEVLAIMLIAGAIASHFGFHGMFWWIVAIGVFLMINAIINAIVKVATR